MLFLFMGVTCDKTQIYLAIGHFPVKNNETMELVIKELKKAFPDFDKIVFTHLEEEEVHK